MKTKYNGISRKNQFRSSLYKNVKVTELVSANVLFIKYFF